MSSAEPHPPSTASVRRANDRTVLDLLWRTPAGEAVAANELIQLSGLTRATVLAVCDELVQLGWLSEHDRTAAAATSGRPPRLFTFRPDAAHVLAVDVGATSIRGAVADLHGRLIGRSQQPAGFAEGQQAKRTATIRRVLADALAAAGVPESSVLAVSFGLAAPVDSSGSTPPPTDGTYWSQMRLDLPAVLAGRPDWSVLVNNDANLAALAVGAEGEADPDGNYVAVLTGERFGAGIVADGRLLLGRNGAAGDMHFLHLFSDDAPLGIAAIARQLWPIPAEGPAHLAVLDAARAGDPRARLVVSDLADRLARIAAVLASLLNPELVVFAGALASSLDDLLETVRERVAAYAQIPPRIELSALGGEIVLIGAVHAGIAEIAQHALDRPARR